MFDCIPFPSIIDTICKQTDLSQVIIRLRADDMLAERPVWGRGVKLKAPAPP